MALKYKFSVYLPAQTTPTLVDYQGDYISRDEIGVAVMNERPEATGPDLALAVFPIGTSIVRTGVVTP